MSDPRMSEADRQRFLSDVRVWIWDRCMPTALYHDAWEVAGDGPGVTWNAANPVAADEIDRLARQRGFRRRIDDVLVGGACAHPDTAARVEHGEVVFHDRPVSDPYVNLAVLELDTDSGSR